MSFTSALVMETGSDKVGLRLAGARDRLGTLQEETDPFLDNEASQRFIEPGINNNNDEDVDNNNALHGQELSETKLLRSTPQRTPPQTPPRSPLMLQAPQTPQTQMLTTTPPTMRRQTRDFQSVDDSTNRQEHDRRLSVFLGTTQPFQRRRTQEEQEIDSNFRWSMCLFHRYTLVFIACISLFIVGITISLIMKKHKRNIL